jgi:hypothetical protein
MLPFVESRGLEVNLYHPAVPKPRTDQVLMIEVLLSSGTDTDRKKDIVAAGRPKVLLDGLPGFLRAEITTTDGRCLAWSL